MPLAGRLADMFASPLTSAMDEFGIDTPQRQASFIAQVAHESAQLRLTRELWAPPPPRSADMRVASTWAIRTPATASAIAGAA